MEHDPLAIVREYLASTSPQVRKNAVTALATLGTADAVEALVDVVSADKDTDVRQAAISELEQLPSGSKRYIDPAVQLAIARGGLTAELYELLGRLHHRGYEVDPGAGGAWHQRVGVAAHAGNLADREGRWHVRVRPMLSGFVWGALGSLIFYLFLNTTIGLAAWSDAAILIYFAGPLVGVLGAFATTQRTNPIDLQYDRRAAMLVEVWYSAAGGAILGALLFLTFVVVQFFTGAFTATDLVVGLVAGPVLFGLVAAAVRAGTITAFGAAPAVRSNRLMQIVMGTAVGVFVVVLAVSLAEWVPLPEALAPMGLAVGAMVATVALMLIPGSAALAAAYTWVDGKAPPGGAAPPPLDRRLSYAAIVVFAAATLGAVIAPGQSATERRAEAEALRAEPLNPVDTTLVRNHLPMDQHFNASSEQVIRAEILDEDRELGRDFVLELWADDGRRLYEGDDPPEISWTVPEGQYYLHAYYHGRDTLADPTSPHPDVDEVLPRVGRHIFGSVMAPSEPGEEVPPFRLSLSIRTVIENSVVLVTDRLRAGDVASATVIAARALGDHRQLQRLTTQDTLLAFAEYMSEGFERDPSALLAAYEAAVFQRKDLDRWSEIMEWSRARHSGLELTLHLYDVLSRGTRAVQEGNVERAIALYGFVESSWPRGPGDDDLGLPNEDRTLGGQWNALCWYGGIRWPSDAQDPTILAQTWVHSDRLLQVCETAVDLMPPSDPDIDNVRDSRGVVRVLTGDVDGAIGDFKAYVQYRLARGGESDSGGLQRQSWVEQLSDQVAPRQIFTPALLEELRGN